MEVLKIYGLLSSQSCLINFETYLVSGPSLGWRQWVQWQDCRPSISAIVKLMMFVHKFRVGLVSNAINLDLHINLSFHKTSLSI